MPNAPARPSGHRPRRPPRRKHPDYDLNVFINCPFDAAYEELFRAMVFSIYACGFILQSAKGISNQNRRFERIIELEELAAQQKEQTSLPSAPPSASAH